MKGCRKELTPYTLCGDIGFDDKIQLCDDCSQNLNNTTEKNG